MKETPVKNSGYVYRNDNVTVQQYRF